MSVRSYSPSLSMPGTPTHHRRLSSSSRRGSTSAPDPWALHALNTPASSTSRLHIVRLPPPTKEELERYEKEHGATRRYSWGSSGMTKSMSAERVSFAGSGSLARTGSIDHPKPRIHPASSTGFLAPQQLYDLAMSSINPRISSDQETAPAPAVFTPLPANHYLPFIVRPNEVQMLLSQGPPRRLWALIKQIYPTNLAEESEDPTKWPFSQLERWMFKVDRHEASDRIWVANARTCISRRSETLWEKLKNALGVPPELELSDDEFSDDDDMEVLSGSVSGLGLSGKALPQPNAAPVEIGEDKPKSDDTSNVDNIDDEFANIGPTGLVMEAIYPSAAPVSPPQHKSSPSKGGSDGFAGGMDAIGEEEEEEEDKSGAVPAPKLKTDNLTANETQEDGKPAEMDPSRMVGITFVSHSKYVPLKQYMDREESDGEAIIDSPLFPGSFASLSSPSALARRGSRGAFTLEQGSMSVRGPPRRHPVGEYAISTGSESDYDGH